MSLKNSAMTVTFSVSQWGGKAYDAETTRQVLDDHRAEQDGGEFHTRLVPKKALFPVQQAATAGRNEHYKLTLPWRDGGERILTSAAFFDYRNALAVRKSAFWDEYQKLEDQWDHLVATAPQRLNGLYKASDFPTKSELRSAYGFSIKFAPLADAADFRVDLGAETEAEIRQNIQETYQQSVGQAQLHLWQRVSKLVAHFAQTMADSKAKFHDTTVENLREIAKLAPKLTLFPDPAVDEISTAIIDMLDDLGSKGKSWSDTMRNNPKHRKVAATKAKRTLADIERIMQGAY